MLNFRQFLSEATTKLTPKQKEIVGKIEHLLSIKIEASPVKRLAFRIDTEHLTDIEIANIERVGRQYKLFRVEYGNKKMWAITD